jgi:hypothetical protein
VGLPERLNDDDDNNNNTDGAGDGHAPLQLAVVPMRGLAVLADQAEQGHTASRGAGRAQQSEANNVRGPVCQPLRALASSAGGPRVGRHMRQFVPYRGGAPRPLAQLATSDATATGEPNRDRRRCRDGLQNIKACADLFSSRVVAAVGGRLRICPLGTFAFAARQPPTVIEAARMGSRLLTNSDSKPRHEGLPWLRNERFDIGLWPRLSSPSVHALRRRVLP